MATYTEWCLELEAALSAPFPPELHKKRRQGGTEITYVEVHDYYRRLNALVGVAGWSMDDPIVTAIDSWIPANPKKDIPAYTYRTQRLSVAQPVTILGVRKVNMGDEIEAEGMYGTVSTNAFSQAFKRTLALFGCGDYLYDEKSTAQAMQPKRATAKARPAKKDAPNGSPKPTAADEFPSGDYMGRKLHDPTVPTAYLHVKVDDFDMAANKAMKEGNTERQKEALDWKHKIEAELQRRKTT